jgi:hypothetical protein
MERKGTAKHCANGTSRSDSRIEIPQQARHFFSIRFQQNKGEPEKCTRLEKNKEIHHNLPVILVALYNYGNLLF